MSRDYIQGGIGERLGTQEHIVYWQASIWDVGAWCGRHQESHLELRRCVCISLSSSTTSPDRLLMHDRRRSDIDNERLPPAPPSAVGQTKAQLQSPTPTPTPIPMSSFMPIPITSRPMTPSDDGRCETPSLERASSPSASSLSSPPTPPPPANSDRRGSLRLGGSMSPSTRPRSVQNAFSMLQAALDGKKGG